MVSRGNAFCSTVAIAAVLICVACTAPVSADLNFLIMGDWGGSETAPYTTSAEIQTASGMQKLAEETGAAHALALGDNFYSHGIHGDAHDPRFQHTFEDVFTGKNLQHPSFSFHVVAGNHDHLGNVTAQIAYSNISPRWSFPDLHYSFTLGGGADPVVEIVMIDTVLIGGNSEVLHSDGTRTSLKGHELKGPEDAVKADAQLVWLEEVLSKSTADYIIVGGHYPVWSICEHGPTSVLVSQLRPLLEKYNVTAYVNGHDHCMQHIWEGKTSFVDYHTIGSAHSNDASTAHEHMIPKDSLRFHSAGKLGGFASVAVSSSGLVLVHRDGDGSVKYTSPTRHPRHHE